MVRTSAFQADDGGFDSPSECHNLKKKLKFTVFGLVAVFTLFTTYCFVME